MACAELVIHVVKHLLVREEVALLAWLVDIYEMVGNNNIVVHVFAQIFSCTNIHAALELARIGADDVRSHFVC